MSKRVSNPPAPPVASKPPPPAPPPCRRVDGKANTADDYLEVALRQACDELRRTARQLQAHYGSYQIVISRDSAETFASDSMRTFSPVPGVTVKVEPVNVVSDAKTEQENATPVTRS